jgi:hypothetical protein
MSIIELAASILVEETSYYNKNQLFDNVHLSSSKKMSIPLMHKYYSKNGIVDLQN